MQEASIHGPQGWQVLDMLAASAQGHSVTRKPVLPSEEEVAANPRARQRQACGCLSEQGAPRLLLLLLSSRGRTRSRKNLQGRRHWIIDRLQDAWSIPSLLFNSVLDRCGYWAGQN